MATSNPEQTVVASVEAAATGAAAVTGDVLQWSNNLSWSIVIFSIVTILLIGITFLIFSFSNIAEISKNFAKHRCNPLIMPFAGQFGYNAKENFEFCITNILNDKASQLFAPLYGILSQFTSILTVIMNATLGIRKLFSNFFLSVNGFIANVRNRIQNLLFQIRISFLKMNNLMGRVYGTMYSVMYMGLSALTMGNNLANNDLVNFLLEFCFDPNTPILMEGGEYKAIKDLRIGDRLSPVLGTRGAPIVTSTFVFDGSRTPVVEIGDVTVSEQHYVEYNGTWIFAGDHPSAIKKAPVPQLICLNVTGNVFYAGRCGLKARDYDETTNPGIADKVMQIALKALNGPCRRVGFEPLRDYSLGFDHELEVYLSDGSLKKACDVKIGDTLEGGVKVVGIVQEKCIDVVKFENRYFSSALLVFHGQTWKRAGYVMPYNRRKGEHVLMNLITEHCAPIVVQHNGEKMYIRDYREVPLPEMEEPYADHLTVLGNQISAPLSIPA